MSSHGYQGYSREHEFLLQLLRRPHPEQSLTLQATAPQVDWQRLFAITPPDLFAFLGYKINENGLAHQCPAPLLKKAADAGRATAARWLRLRFELRNMVGQFRRRNLDLVILKGAVLAFLAYPDSSLRPVSDVDLLVRSESLVKALQLVEDAGFHCPKRFEFASPLTLKDSVVPGEEISLPLEKPGTSALLEVHTQLESAVPWFPVPIEKIWERTEEIDWNDVRVRVLDPHEFLFHLVLHLTRGHFFSLGLRPLLDVHLWVELQKKRLDWEWILRESVRRRYVDWMYITLKMVHDFFRTPIPPEFFGQVAAPPQLERLQNLAYEQVWADPYARSMVPPRLAITLSQPSVGRAISSLFRRLAADGSFDTPTIPVLQVRKNGRWLRNFLRMLLDLKVKAPVYLRAWRNGGLTWSRLGRAARLLKGQAEIRDILMVPERQKEEHGKTVEKEDSLDFLR